MNGRDEADDGKMALNTESFVGEADRPGLEDEVVAGGWGWLVLHLAACVEGLCAYLCLHPSVYLP